VNSRYSIES